MGHHLQPGEYLQILERRLDLNLKGGELWLFGCLTVGLYPDFFVFLAEKFDSIQADIKLVAPGGEQFQLEDNWNI